MEVFAVSVAETLWGTGMSWGCGFNEDYKCSRNFGIEKQSAKTFSITTRKIMHFASLSATANFLRGLIMRNERAEAELTGYPALG
mgnify:CR=1 FL=1